MTKKGKIALITMLCMGTAAVAGAVGTTRAGDFSSDIPTYALNPVVVTAQRMEKDTLNTPAGITVLTEKDIKESGMTNVTDVLSLVPGISNFSYGPGGQAFGAMDARSSIRGFDKGTLILINGVPKNLIGKGSVGNIPLDSIQRIEVLKGASSVLYGAEAMGGVINIITKTEFKPGVDVTVGAGNVGHKNIRVAYSTGDIIASYEHNHYGAVDRMSIDRPATTGKFGKPGYYTSYLSGDKTDFNLSGRLTDHLTFNVSSDVRNTGFGQIANTLPTEAENLKKTSLFYYNDVTRHIDLTYKTDDNLKSTLYYDDQKLYGEKYDGNHKLLEVNNSNYKTNHLGLDTQKSWALRDGKDTALVGVLLQKEHYKALNSGAISKDRQQYALYGQYNYEVTPKLTASLGLRYQMVRGNDDDHNVLLPQFQTLYRLNDNSSWYINVGRAFQMPNLHDTISKDLKPQEGWNYETGYKYVDDKIALDISFYVMRFKNLFGWVKNPLTNIYERVNLGQFKNHGVEVNYSRKLNDRWKAKLGASFSDPLNKKDAKSDWEQTVPKTHFSMGLSYEYARWNGGVTFNYMTNRLDGLHGKPNPDLINLNAMVAYNFENNDKITLNLNNLLNRRNVITIGKYDYWDLPFNWTLSYTHRF